MKKFILIITLMLSFSAFALDLSDAKQQGLVGERMDGLLGVVKASQEVILLFNFPKGYGSNLLTSGSFN